ncbi:DUF4435 domain-containing protein [Thiofilum flexile]|uniref:DUF4435 domain-containing protein n=1 Tax=Thiofilum flexile TaxID=125627 RepID=UPI0003624B3B|nr:DUF4435 domain-containing protein [Thiofilum flexile]
MSDLSKAQHLVYNVREIVNEAILLGNVFDGGFLLVEGDSDVRLWTKVVKKEYILKADGKNNIIEASNILDSQKDQRVLGVVDADFDRINRVTYSDRIVLTDMHDLEILLLHSSALAQVQLEYFDEENCQEKFERKFGKSPLSFILEYSRIFGVLRYLHYHIYSDHSPMYDKDREVFSFNALMPNKYVGGKNLAFDCKRLKKDFCDKTSIDRSYIDQKYDELLFYPDQEICQGHDTLNLICLAFREICKPKKGVSSEELAKLLRLAFSKNDLCQTTMFQALKQKAEAWNLNMFPSCT